MKKTNIISGVIILTVTSVIIRIIGFIFRIFLSNKIGAEGMGLYQLLISVYSLGAAFSVSGISIVVSSLIAYEISRNNKGNAKSILRTSLVLTSVMGILVAILIYYNANFICQFFLKDERLLISVKTIAFCFPFISVFACLNGYFTGICDVKKPMIGQIIEQIVRIAVIFIFIDKALIANMETAIVLTALGIVLGEAISAIYLAMVYFRIRMKNTNKTSRLFLTKIVSMCVPLSINSYIASIFHTAENLLIPQMLITYGLSHQMAISTLGVLKGMVMPILFFPCSFLGSITTMLLPAVSAKRGSNHLSKIDFLVSKVLKLTFLMSGIIIFILIVFANDIGYSLYKNEMAATILMLISPVSLFIYVDMILITILNAFEKQVVIMRNSFIELITRLILVCTLIPKFGFNAYIFVVIVTSMLSVILNYFALTKVVTIKFDFMNWLVFPSLCALTATLISKLVSNFIVAILISLLLYVMFLLISGSLKISELKFVLNNAKKIRTHK